MFYTVPMTDSHMKKLEVTGMKMCSRHKQKQRWIGCINRDNQI